MTNKTIYLDVCALSRPFDDQSFLRIRMETEAVNLILSEVRQGTYGLLVSPVHIREIAAIGDAVERVELQMLLAALGRPVMVNRAKARARAEELIRLGFGVADAAHVAFAEQPGADFISSDDRLIKKCAGAVTAVWCGNPVSFCEKESLR
jgi:predicted nucleic acid-binding protein